MLNSEQHQQTTLKPSYHEKNSFARRLFATSATDRAGAIYYKTIMYMYRFNTDVGFLLHPVKPEENASGGVISSLTYNIPGGRGGKLHVIGITIPRSAKNYEYFKEAMVKENGPEDLFRKEIKGKINI